MRILDLRCKQCDAVERSVRVEQGERYSRCACGGSRAVTWDGGVSPMLDAYSTPQYDDGLGQFVTSTRERERIAKENLLTPCGDKVGGARSEYRLTGRLTFDLKNDAA